MVAALELQNPIAPGSSSSKAHRCRGRLGPARHQAYLLHAGNGSADALGQLDFARVRRTKRGALVSRSRHRVDDRRVRVAEDQGSPGAHVIDVAVSIDIEQRAPLAALKENGLSADSSKGTHRRIDPARHEGLGSGK